MLRLALTAARRSSAAAVASSTALSTRSAAAATTGSKSSAAAFEATTPDFLPLLRRRTFASSSPSSPPPPPRPPPPPPPSPRRRVVSSYDPRRSSEQALYLAALVLGMVGATYGAVPLYRLFCQATGFGGTVRSGATVEEKLALRRRARAGDRKARAAAAEGSSEEAPRPASRPAPREITVTFNAEVADGLPWRFSPAQRAVVVRPGQSALAFFTARNLGERPVTGVSTYNVAPQQAGAHFNKVQCFCFEEQRLQPGVRRWSF